MSFYNKDVTPRQERAKRGGGGNAQRALLPLHLSKDNKIETLDRAGGET